MTREVLSRADYFARWSDLHGGFDPRGSRFVGPWLSFIHALAVPFARVGVAPDVVTLLGGAVAGSVIWLCALGGHIVIVAAVVVGLSGVLDSLDGAVAVISNRATAWGSVLDSVVDRLSDGFYLIALWVVGAPAWVCVAAGGLVLLQEYTRARGAVAGASEIGVVTVGERPTRVIVIAMFLLGAGIYVESAVQWVTVAAYLSLGLAVVSVLQLLVTLRGRLSVDGE